MSTEKNVITVYAESTPNPQAMKFVANIMLVKGSAVDYKSAAEAVLSPLAARLFTFPFVKGIFIAANFVSVTKSDGVEWNEVVMELREYIRDFLASGEPAVREDVKIAPDGEGTVIEESGGQTVTGVQGSIEEKITEVLEEYIRPAVEQDGGAIQFHSFNNGVVKVLLKGACSGCPSSTITLKAGIEGLLKRMVPEVQSVEAEGV